MKRKIIIGVAIGFVIIAVIMLSKNIMNDKNTSNVDKVTKAEEIERAENNVQALENEEEITKNWDTSKINIEHDTIGVPVPVPKGFTASKAEGEQTVNTGFVIYEGEVTAADSENWTNKEAWQASKNKNQFVWVPVKNASERIYEISDEKSPLKARLWKFTSTGRETILQGNGNRNREPVAAISGRRSDNLKYLGNYLGLQDYSGDIWYKELQVEYDTAMKSIEKYGGFYIGRYETGDLNKNISVVKRMNTNIGKQNWYKMYYNTRNISSNPNIQTSMIWGCLFDETLQWLIDTGAKTQEQIAKNSFNWGNYFSSKFNYYDIDGNLNGNKLMNNATIIPTGSSEHTKANNIYDLAGNVYEWTIEGNGWNYRCYRGGNVARYSNDIPAAERGSFYPDYIDEYFGCRAYLYIK